MSCASRLISSVPVLTRSASLRRFALCMAVLAGTLAEGVPAWAASSTTTTLTVTAGGSDVTSVSSGAVVTLTAIVVSGSTPVNPGQVKFCDAGAKYCEDAALLATAQLTSTGTATYKFRPGIGSHSYQAVFVGTKTYAKSSSTTEELGVTFSGKYPTTATITSSGSPGDYTLTAAITGIGSSLSPTGIVSFVDTTNGNGSLGSATLGAATVGENFNDLATYAGAFESNTWFVTNGDFNNDGIPDLATVTNDIPGKLTTFLGNGDGTFTRKSSVTTGPNSLWIAVGDFDGDGNIDLAVVNAGDNTTTILLGNGDGTFFTKTTVSTFQSVNPGSVVVGDFNNDGILDLVAGNKYTSTVTVWLGNGDGTFALGPTSPNVGYNIAGLAVGDFNRDGIPDLAVASMYDGTLTVLLGNGDGTFTTKATLSIGPPSNPDTGPIPVASGDFNGDGIPDLAVITPDETLTILLGNGDGTFVTEETSNAGIEPYSIVEADFNGDGISDLAIANYEQDTVLLGKGDGTFVNLPMPEKSPVIGGLSIAASDLNGDGTPDLINQAGVVLLNEITETATAALSGVSGPTSGTHLAQAQYSGDLNFGGSMSGTVALTKSQIATTLSLTSSSNPSNAFPVTLTATLSPYSSGMHASDGEVVTFYSNGTSIGTGTLSSGVATLSASVLSGGTDSLTATYAGDANFSGATSNPVRQLVKPIAPTPVFNPPPGTYPSVALTITDSAPETSIYYTTYLPGGNPHSIFSTPYNGPVTFTTTGTFTVQAIAIGSSYTNSAIASATYTIGPVLARPVFTPAAGSYTTPQTVTISDISTRTIYYTTDGSMPTTSSPQYAGPITVSANESIKAIAVLSGFTNSPVASAGYIIEPQLPTPTIGPAPGTYTSTMVTITDATPGVTIYYALDGIMPTTAFPVYKGPVLLNHPGNYDVRAIAVASGYINSEAASAVYTIRPVLARPVFTPAAGSYTTPQTVTISDISTKTIYYTTDGSMPTTSSPQYNGPITVSANETIKAIAVLSGYVNSPVSLASYTIGP